MDPSSASSASSSSSCLSVSSRASSSTPQQKLKDACDLCSAFKIRCDKGKPSCGRCANLNQPCSYSPARRAGRPHRLRQQHRQQQQQTPPPQQQPSDQRPQQPQLGSLLTTCFNQHPASFATGDFDWGSYDWGMELVDEANPPAGPVASPGMPLRAGQSSHTVFTTNKPVTQVPISHEDIDPHLHRLPTPADENYVVQSGTNTATHGDCARTAAAIIEELDPGRKPGCRAPSAEFGATTKITTACQRLLTILVCPCSEQPAVALLVASACIALLDAVLHQQQQQQQQHPHAPHHHRQHTPDEPTSSFPWPPMPTSPHHRHARSMPLSASLNDYYADQGEFDGLAKIAKVVLRFTQRYAQDEGEGGVATRTLVDPIVVLLRSKLQFVTGEATGRVVL